MKIRVGVLFGGKSVEHEISVISALQAIEHFDRSKYDVVPIYITKYNMMYIGEQIGNIESYKNISKLLNRSQRVVLVNESNKVAVVQYPVKFFKPTLGYIDIAFPIVHGTNVEDGTLQGYLKMLNLPFVGCDVMASAAGMDKYVMKAILKDNGIPCLDCICITAKDYSVNESETISKIESAFSYPVIVKPVNLGSSVGISIAQTREDLCKSLEEAFIYSPRVLVELAIKDLKEINCSVLGNQYEAIASECEEPLNAKEILSYEDKYMSGSKGFKNSGSKGMASLTRRIPASISSDQRDRIRQLAIKAFRVLGCNGVSRIDFMIDMSTGQIYLNEINTIPGSLSFYLWEYTGMTYQELLTRMIDLALERKREDDEIIYSFDTNVLSGIDFHGKVSGN